MTFYYRASCTMLLVLLFFHVSLCAMWHSAQSVQFCQVSLLVITAKQLQWYLVLLRQGLASHKRHGAGKVVEVVAHNHFNSSRATHCSINLLEDRNWALVGGSTRGDLQFHIIDVVTWRTAGRERCKWIQWLIAKCGKQSLCERVLSWVLVQLRLSRILGKYLIVS